MKRLSVVSILIIMSLIIIPIVSADDAIYSAVMPLAWGSIQPNAGFTYNVSFATDSACTNIVKSVSKSVTTNAQGLAVIRIDTSSMEDSPFFICEYRDGTLRATHNVSSSLADYIYSARNYNASGNISLPDNNRMFFGDSKDVETYWDGTNFRMMTGSGQFRLTGDLNVSSKTYTNYLNVSNDTHIEGTLWVEGNPNSFIYGGSDVGDDLRVCANSGEADPCMYLNGGDTIFYYAANDWIIELGGTAGTTAIRIRNDVGEEVFNISDLGGVWFNYSIIHASQTNPIVDTSGNLSLSSIQPISFDPEGAGMLMLGCNSSGLGLSCDTVCLGHGLTAYSARDTTWSFVPTATDCQGADLTCMCE